MPNLRVIYNNAAKRSSISADSYLGNLPPSNLLTDVKGQVWRADNSATRTLTLTWNTSEIVGCVALPFCSLSSVATMRVKGYSNTAATTMLFDTGAILACPSSLFTSSNDWGILPFGVNAYSYGGSAYGVVFFQHTAVKALKVEISDPTNSLGYIEAGCIVVGPYWSPTYNVQAGEAQMDVVDNSKHERTESGDLMTSRGSIYKSLNLTLQRMPSTDRDAMWRVLRGNGMSSPVFVSVSPESTDKMDEQIFSIYGKLSKGSSLQYQFMNQYASSLTIEEL